MRATLGPGQTSSVTARDVGRPPQSTTPGTPSKADSVRNLLLDLAARGHCVPIAADLVLHEHADAEQILGDGQRLGAVIAEAARKFRTPLAFPVMDLRLEKLELLRHFDVAESERENFHFAAAPTVEQRDEYHRALRQTPPGVRIAASLEALRYVAAQTDLTPIGMCIGPFSLTTKLMADPICPTYLAGSGVAAADDSDVALLEACLEISTVCVLRQVELAIAADARAVFIAEPAANRIYFSPLQLETGSDIFDRCVLGPNRRIAALLAEHGAGFIFHCCGEITNPMLDGFCSLHPALLSLGSSRCLWEDAARVPKDIVLYGNLPSKMFYSDASMPADRVIDLARELVDRMAACGHPFILGTECDTLHVPDYAETIRSKVSCLLGCACGKAPPGALRITSPTGRIVSPN